MRIIYQNMQEKKLRYLLKIKKMCIRDREKVEHLENIQKYLQDKEIVKFIYIPNRIVSVIVK